MMRTRMQLFTAMGVFVICTAVGSLLPAQVIDESGVAVHNYPTERITVPSRRFAHGPHVRAAFREVVSEVREAIVEIRSEGRQVALGGVVGPDGWILTKASALVGPITCRFFDGRELDARIVGASREFDVAMLKVAAKQLPTLVISDTVVPVVGSWLASVGMDSYPIAVGIVSVEPREIPHQAGILGIQLDAVSGQALIVRVFPGSAASKAGLLVNDVILEIDAVATPTRESLVRRVQEFNPGDHVNVKVKRGEEQLTLDTILMGRFPGLMPSRNEFQNRLGSGLSERRFGFPSAFQHDTVINASACGGPVVNLDGEVVGFNIARSGRTETYAITAASISKLLYELMSGNLEPELEAEAAAPPADRLEESKTKSEESPLVPLVPAGVP
ncbi:S1C family serine protease [Bythopirellula polymerisocia]|uniref:Putative periplasmic serine endoprotease DegP-like n=1 Tax=Bythopirellula polymerisocia TaxID=2528003 RepID=A0A5C6CG42_9BACT|nr:PDZ domain-containing protein [Bythopirellula polymerisocia]TWU23610.1 putative periplasmic serine endoprotease DegP-like precursor [Bythopirellula polymerisocia]